MELVNLKARKREGQRELTMTELRVLNETKRRKKFIPHVEPDGLNNSFSLYST